MAGAGSLQKCFQANRQIVLLKIKFKYLFSHYYQKWKLTLINSRLALWGNTNTLSRSKWSLAIGPWLPERSWCVQLSSIFTRNSTVVRTRWLESFWSSKRRRSSSRLRYTGSGRSHAEVIPTIGKSQRRVCLTSDQLSHYLLVWWDSQFTHN